MTDILKKLEGPWLPAPPGYASVRAVKLRLKEYCQKNKWQRWDICEELSVWHYVTKTPGLKSVKLRMSNHFSESRDPSYVSSATCPESPRKEQRTKSFRLQSTPGVASLSIPCANFYHA